MRDVFLRPFHMIHVTASMRRAMLWPPGRFYKAAKWQKV